ncbi:hypothetical protein B0H66DRAFT_214393 [Apodospora peruviana]|uniref:Uncharacterized protein n=1 Tax=Apodospora peruviana TaxID=516989 RepID=A0AAE0ID28_9PEZI|nr:hypothetical protein B0H66DRAFT_214393 [Apodospora peruviana]
MMGVSGMGGTRAGAGVGKEATGVSRDNGGVGGTVPLDRHGSYLVGAGLWTRLLCCVDGGRRAHAERLSSAAQRDRSIYTEKDLDRGFRSLQLCREIEKVKEEAGESRLVSGVRRKVSVRGVKRCKTPGCDGTKTDQARKMAVVEEWVVQCSAQSVDGGGPARIQGSGVQECPGCCGTCKDCAPCSWPPLLRTFFGGLVLSQGEQGEECGPEILHRDH